MKSILFSVVLTVCSSAFAIQFPITLVGQTTVGDPCWLEIAYWGYSPVNVESWETLVLEVRSSWQKPENPAVILKSSPTPWAHYGKNKETYDQFAVNFTVGELNLQGITSYLFQTWAEDTGLVQTHCRFN